MTTLDKAEKIAGNQHLKMVLALVVSGVPYDVAECLTQEELMAWNVIVGELKSGKRFDWGSQRWIENEPVGSFN